MHLPRGPSRRRPAAVGVRNGCPDLPAGCLRAACRAGAACCRSLCCAAGAACLLGPCCSDRTPARDLFSLAAPVGVRGCWRCCVGVGWVQKRVWWSRFEWSTGFEFLAVSSMPPAQFRCQLNRQRQSRDPGGPDRTLVCIQPTPSAQAVPSPTKPLPKWAKITPTAAWRTQ